MGGVAFILGIMLLITSLIIGGMVAAIGLIVIVAALVSKPKIGDEDNSYQGIEEIETLENRLKNIEKEKTELKSGYYSLLEALNRNPENITLFLANTKSEISEYNRFAQIAYCNTLKRDEIGEEVTQLKAQIESFLLQYCDSLVITDYETALSNLRNSVAKFNELSRAKGLYEDTKKFIEKSKEILKEEFQYYYEEFPKDISVALKELNEKYYNLKLSENKLEESRANKEKFKLENNIAELESIRLPDKPSNQLIEDIRKEKEDINHQKGEVIKKIERYKKDINLLIQEVDKIEDTETTITQLELDIVELQKKHDLLTITKECMIKAKENLATKYMGNMSGNFLKYLGKLNSGKVDSYEIDINLDVKIEHQGQLQDGNQLSQGLRDLTQLCMRMALVEAVYKGVKKPILVLDDPFINLDKLRLENAIKLLKEISLEYQVIYFICHNSRSV